MRREARARLATSVMREESEPAKSLPERMFLCEAQRTAVEKRRLVKTNVKAMLIREMSKRMAKSGTFVPTSELFKWMRQEGYLLSDPETYNAPSDECIRNGWMVAAKSSSTANGYRYLTPYITEEGYSHFFSIIIGKGGAL